MVTTGRRISSTIMDFIFPKRDILTGFMAETGGSREFLQPSWIWYLQKGIFERNLCSRLTAEFVICNHRGFDISKEGYFNGIYGRDWMQNFCSHRGVDISTEGYFNGINAHDWPQNFCNHRGFDNSKQGYLNQVYSRDSTQNFCNHRGFDISKKGYFNGIYGHDWEAYILQPLCIWYLQCKQEYFNGVDIHDWTQNFWNHRGSLKRDVLKCHKDEKRPFSSNFFCNIK